jgi:6-pyruvoyltetrahydropterin/6-carboxytetrahydropterin synthase
MQDKNNERVIGIKLPNNMTNKGISMLMDVLEELCSGVSVLEDKKVEKPSINPFDEKVMRIGREFTFDSAHHLLNYDGACANVHGHTYHLHIMLLGKVKDGFVIDFKLLKEIVQEYVISKLDHENLNQVLDFNPTAENIAVKIWEMLDPVIDEAFKGRVVLERVKLYETPGSFVEYDGGLE